MASKASAFSANELGANVPKAGLKVISVNMAKISGVALRLTRRYQYETDVSTVPGILKPIQHFGFTAQQFVGRRARIGVVVLASDYTIEHEFRMMFDLPGVDFYVARIANSPIITPQSLAAMGPSIAETAARLLPGDTLDVLAYACTSATTVLGIDAVQQFLCEAKPEAKPSTPITAASAALKAFNALRIAVLTPYSDDVNERIAASLEEQGFEIAAFGSFHEPDDRMVAQIDDDSLTAAAKSIVQRTKCDALFLSCTSIRASHLIERLEAELDLSITTSNHAMAWHCLRLAGVDDRVSGFGGLFHLPFG